eukprot:gb/GECG01016754.1/.p1 GENE.gb/GECG01016754.1/~~gb/GECG01016754.1/.p1  ORF type:complete len:754 (+),score=107.58 gb/GECG01016754.1/:1-2262(+)
MSEWDAATTRSVPQPAPPSQDGSAGQPRAVAQRQFRDFIREYREGLEYPYKQQLLAQYHKGEYYLEVDLRHLADYSTHLHDLIVRSPNEYLPVFEGAIQDVLKGLFNDPSLGPTVPDFQVTLKGNLSPTYIRDITADDVNKLIQVPGIVINASRTRAKASKINIYCNTCGFEQDLSVPRAFGGVVLPRRCPEEQRGPDGVVRTNPEAKKCKLDPFHIRPDRSQYMDQQTLKLQESPESVPTGEMPRHMLLSVDRSLTDSVAPGTRISVLGVSSIFLQNRGGPGGAGAVNVRTPYLRVVGVMVEEEGSGRAMTQFSEEDAVEFNRMAEDDKSELYKKMANSVAPSIQGDYTEDIKKAILALLMGGSRKVLPDGLRLRGDINVLLLGDPSTAKSQFLKFVEKVAPVGVYTSGKGSSAAGLTASVIRDSKGEFYLEGGAMVLADGGVVCIDEFDKMREEDRVAIHEAMEQQTISVAKAGITTVLNSRAAVLAAANPVFGRYDDDKSAAENIDFLPTILSRFDLIFIVRDVRDQKRDEEMCRHVLRIHMNAQSTDQMSSAAADESDEFADINLAKMKKYIAYARSRCAPRLSESAAEKLRNEYVNFRNSQKERKSHDLERTGRNSRDSVIPITVRQLEALIRMSEALAKVTLSPEATEEHVDEAIRLFRVSTMNAADSGLSHFYMSKEMMNSVKRVEERITRGKMLPPQTLVSAEKVRSNLMNQGVDAAMIKQALRVMESKGEIQFLNERRYVKRIK